MRGFALGLDIFHAAGDFVLVAGGGTKTRGDEGPILRHAALPVSEGQIGKRQPLRLARRIEGFGVDDDVLDLAAEGAGVHAERAADGAGNAGKEFETRKPGIAGAPGDVHVMGGGAGGDFVAVDADFGEAPAETHDDALDAAVADNDVGADADHGHRHMGGLGGQQPGKIVGIGGFEQHLRRAADLEPCEAGDRGIGGQFTPDRGQAIHKACCSFSRHHSPPPCPWRAPGEVDRGARWPSR